MVQDSHRSTTKEASLIETIKIISKDNDMLKEQIESLKDRMLIKQSNLVSVIIFDLIIGNL